MNECLAKLRIRGDMVPGLALIFSAGLSVKRKRLPVGTVRQCCPRCFHFVAVPDERLCTSIAASFFIAWFCLSCLCPQKLTECARRVRDRCAELFCAVVGFAVVEIILHAVIVAQEENLLQGPLLLEWPWWLLPTTFIVLTIVGIWMLMIPSDAAG
jgi:hypothetical protein